MIECRSARSDDMAAVAHVFFAAFADSVRHATAGAVASEAMADLFSVALVAEPGSFIVAESEDRVVGYVLATGDLRRLRRVAFWRGHWLQLLWRALAGRYGLNWRTLRVVLGDKLAFLRGARLCGAHHARMLSLGVHPDYQGRGIGRRLLTAALEYLHAQGARTIRLEVRPNNARARHLYEALGFRYCGEYRDTQGKWLIMVKDQ